MSNAIIILGYANDSKGNLRQISVERCDKGIEVYRLYSGSKIVVTGGFSKRFNTTDKPHAEYEKAYLLSKGIPESDILDLVISSNTFEDAQFSQSIIESGKFEDISLVTSDFHMPRAMYLFQNALQGKVIKPFPSKSSGIGSYILSKIFAVRENLYLKKLKKQ